MRLDSNIVLIVDDDAFFCAYLTKLLEKKGYGVLTVESGPKALKLLNIVLPDIILLDILMPGMNGIESARWIKEIDQAIRVILVTMEVSKDYVSAGIKSGVDGYLPKDVDFNVLHEAIRTVKNGGRFFNEAITNLVFEDFYQKKKLTNTNGKVTLPNDLTKREQEVLALVASGKSNQEVADDLFISIKTVDTHKNHILDKLGLKNTAELVKYAIKNKLISLD